MEKTFSIIKPDAVKAGNAGAILSRIEKAGFRIVGLRMRSLTAKEAEGFYHVHKARGFFGELVAFMSSGPCITIVLERDNVILSPHTAGTVVEAQIRILKKTKANLNRVLTGEPLVDVVNGVS